MADKIILKNSSEAGKVPQPADLDIGELAVNASDGKVFTKKSDGTVTELSGVSGSTTPSSDFYQANQEFWDTIDIPDDVGANSSTWTQVDNDGDTVFVASGQTGDNLYVIRSYDMFETHEDITPPEWQAQTFGITTIRYANGVLLVSTNTSKVYRSIDDGNTFVEITANFQTTPPILYGGFDFNGVDTWIACGSSGYAAKSVDNGETWTDLPQGLNSGSTTTTLRYAKGVGNTWIVGGSSGYAARSIDNGVTWTALPKGVETGYTSVTCVMCYTDGAGMWIYCGYNGYASRSADNGDTWTALPRGMNSGYNGNTRVFDVGNNELLMIQTSYNGKCSRSTDQGLTWTATIAPGSNDTRGAAFNGATGIEIAALGAVYKTTDGDYTKHRINIGPISAPLFYSFFDQNGKWFLFGNYGILITSTDQGQSWQRHPGTGVFGPPEFSDGDGDNVVIVLDTSGYAARSEDNGDTWTALPQFLNSNATSGNAKTFFCDKNGTWMTGWSTGHAARSLDNGATWSPMSRGLSSGSGNSAHSITHIAGDGNGNWVSMVGSGYGSYSLNNGQNWTRYSLPCFGNNIKIECSNGGFNEAKTRFVAFNNHGYTLSTDDITSQLWDKDGTFRSQGSFSSYYGSDIGSIKHVVDDTWVIYNGSGGSFYGVSVSIDDCATFSPRELHIVSNEGKKAQSYSECFGLTTDNRVVINIQGHDQQRKLYISKI